MAITGRDIDRIKGPRSPEEDDKLQRLVEKHGPRNWSLISKSIPGCSGKSCRLRWCNQLSPQVEHRAFTAEEDETIVSKAYIFCFCFMMYQKHPNVEHKSREAKQKHHKVSHKYF
ncbi:unnamed protein product [Linum tenue]|uniref:Uncharacterized protein n=1 Tax=Linum tenue TaxID=586396 RepID=A0AAV0ILW8_9ROSI|nr:unnamed protein product [Linum tenue]